MASITQIPKKVKNRVSKYIDRQNLISKGKKEFDESKIQACATGLWPSIHQHFFEQPFVNALQSAAKNINADELQYCFYKPKIEFFSVNCRRQEIIKSKALVKIFYTGEDVNKNYTNYRDLMLDNVDLAIGFDYPETRNNAENYLRYPYWMMYYFGYTEDKDKIKEKVDWFNARQNCKERFCSYVAFHDDDGLRKCLIDMAEKVAPVSCGGASYHNDDSLFKEFNDNKAEYISHFMFNICPENVSVKGYTTEKVFQSFASGCIPIYYGSEGQPETFVNTNAIVLYNGNNEDEVINKIKLLKEDEKYYNDFINQPRLFESAVDCIYQMNHDLRTKYEEVLERKLLNK